MIVAFFKQDQSDTGLGSLKIQASLHIVTGESLAKFYFALYTSLFVTPTSNSALSVVLFDFLFDFEAPFICVNTLRLVLLCD